MRARLGLIAIVSSLLAACGGGGGGGTNNPPVSQQPPVSNPNPPSTPTPTPDPTPNATPDPDPETPPDPTPTAQDAVDARNSQLQMIQRAYAQQLVITWLDTFADETGFRIEMRAAGGSWQSVESLPATAGTGSAHQWRRVLDRSRNYRVIALKNGYSVPLETATGQSEFAIDLANGLSVFIFDPEPLSGTKLVGATTFAGIQSITYYVDGDEFATGAAARNFSVDWNTTNVPDGRHLLEARAAMSSGVIFEAEQSVRTDNSNLAAALTAAYAPASSSEVRLTSTATADVGIESVQFLVNDTLVQTVTTGTNNQYVHTLSTAGLPAGTSTFKAIARDNDGNTVEATRQLRIDNPPALSVDSPFEGTNEWDLQVTGTFTDDRPGATLSVTVGNTNILQTSTPGAFSSRQSLAALGPGEHTLTFRVLDADGHQTVRHKNIVLQHEDAYTTLIGNGATSIVGVGDGAMLWENRDIGLLYRDSFGMTTAFPVPIGLSQFSAWGLDSSYVVVSATGPAPSTDTHIYLFGSGATLNVSQPTGETVNYSPVLRFPWLAWTSGSGATAQHQLYNIQTQERISVPLPAGTISLGGIAYDLANTPAGAQLFFWALTSGSGSASVSEIYRFDITTRTTHAVTTGGGLKHRYVETDNQRVAWRTHLGNGVFRVFVAPVTNPTDITTVTSTASWFTLKDGQLVWTESNGDGTSVLKVDDGTTTTVVSAEVSTPNVAFAPASASIGQITFIENGALRMWDSVRGKRLILNTVPTQRAINEVDRVFYGLGTESLALYLMEFL